MKVLTKVLMPVGVMVLAASMVGVAIAVAERPPRPSASSASVGLGDAAAVDAPADRPPTGQPPTGQAVVGAGVPVPEGSLSQPSRSAVAASTGLVRPGTSLAVARPVTSSNGRYTLVLQADGNLVLRDAAKRALWSTQTHENPGAVARFDGNGNLVVAAADGRTLWHSATSGTGTVLVVQNDGNLVIYNDAKKGVWSSQAQAVKLYPNQALRANQSRTSANGKFLLAQYADGNLVVRTTPDNRVLWASQTHENPGAFTMIGSDGNVVVYGRDHKPLWVSATRSAGASFVLGNDGNAVVVSADGKGIWGTNTHGVSQVTKGQVLRPGQYRRSLDGRYRLVQGTDGNLVLQNAQGKAIWSSGTHGHPGSRTVMQLDGNLVVQDSAGKGIWSTRTHGTAAALVLVQDDGNLVLYDSANTALWSSNTVGR